MIKIAILCHKFKVPLIIDEAHGSHIRFLNLPEFQGVSICMSELQARKKNAFLFDLIIFF
jgi:hypothetical protein